MAKIIQIGNSQGIRIPKPIIALAELEDKELDFVVMDSGLLITPQKKLELVGKLMMLIYQLIGSGAKAHEAF